MCLIFQTYAELGCIRAAKGTNLPSFNYSTRRPNSSGVLAPMMQHESRSFSDHPSPERRLAFAVPGDLATPTGGYCYDRHIIEEIRRLGWRVDIADIGDSFPFPSNAQRTTALAKLRAVPAGCPTILDGLAFGALPEAGVLRSRMPLIALVHLPLALDPGLDIKQAQTFHESERAALAAAARVVVTSAATAKIVTADYDVPADRVRIVQPGNGPMSKSAPRHVVTAL